MRLGWEKLINEQTLNAWSEDDLARSVIGIAVD